jgi:hypothetical protein
MWAKPYVPPVGSFAEKVVMLDAALTGKPWADACHTAQNQQKILASPEAFLMEPLYYLSDGGYSRLTCGVYCWPKWHDAIECMPCRIYVVGTPEHCRAEMDAALARSSELVVDIERALQDVLARV